MKIFCKKSKTQGKDGYAWAWKESMDKNVWGWNPTLDEIKEMAFRIFPNTTIELIFL
jgi:hypothetical protein